MHTSCSSIYNRSLDESDKLKIIQDSIWLLATQILPNMIGQTRLCNQAPSRRPCQHTTPWQVACQSCEFESMYLFWSLPIFAGNILTVMELYLVRSIRWCVNRRGTSDAILIPGGLIIGTLAIKFFLFIFDHTMWVLSIFSLQSSCQGQWLALQSPALRKQRQWSGFFCLDPVYCSLTLLNTSYPIC